MPSSAANTYQDGIEGKLLSAIATSTTTGVKFKVKQINGVTPTVPTGAFRLHITQVTATTSKHEVVGVAAGTTQSGQTVTLGTLTRGLPLNDGTDFTGSGTPQSFAAGADVFLSWDAHDAAQTAFKDTANTFTQDQTLATTKKLILGGSSRAIYDDGNEIYLKSGTTVATSLASLAAGGGTDHKVLNTSSDTTANYLSSKLSAGAGISLSTQNGGGNENTQIAAVNTVATGHTGLSSVTTGGILIGAGTSNMTIIGPGSSGQVPVSNGTTIAMGTAATYAKVMYLGASSSGARGGGIFDTHSYTIPANDLISGVAYEVRGSYTVSALAGGVIINPALGGSQIVVLSTPIGGTTTSSGTFFFVIRGTTAAGGSAAIRVELFHNYATSSCAGYVASTAATNGTLALQVYVDAGSSVTAKLESMTVTRISTTAS